MLAWEKWIFEGASEGEFYLPDRSTNLIKTSNYVGIEISSRMILILLHAA